MTDPDNQWAGQGFDPYRYGPPAQPTPMPAPAMQQGWNSGPTGKQILRASWNLVRRDRQLIWLPVLGTLFGAIAYLVIFVPGLVLDIGGHHGRWFIYPFVIVGGFLASVIGIFFQAALVVGAYQRADGYEPSFGSALSGAWRLRRQVLTWAVFTSSVGAVIRAVEQRLGIFGRVLGFLGGIAWAVATFFAVPAIVAEGIGPIEALKKSAHTIRQMWGTSVRTTLRFGFIQIAVTLLPIVALVAGVAIAVTAAHSSNDGVAAAGIVVAVLAFVVLIALGAVFGAITTYARALIYRWATGRPVPGIDPALFAGAFAPRRGRWNR